jgi:Papain family cysteine protease
MPQFIRSARSAGSPIRTLDVRADDTDARDYIFQPSLALLPTLVDHRGSAPVLDQLSEGACVGFALATVINVSLTRRTRGQRRPRARGARSSVSPRMLYEMGRRYDEWNGESYEGTSLRGAMKGWHKQGVTTDDQWPYHVKRTSVLDRQFTPERARDAARRPIGAYYRIVDSDVSHLQAALVESDAVLASAWVHRGWQHESLSPARGRLRTIRWQRAVTGLHAFAIVGYTPDGFIIQNSWGPRWGSAGYALLTYDDWFENRQDAWVGRPGPETRDSGGTPKVYVVGFAGGGDGDRAGTTVSGLDLDPEAVHYLVNTGDRGELSAGGVVGTREDELAGMAARVRLAPPLRDGHRHVILYAHGGLNTEGPSAVNAGRLWALARQQNIAAYFFIWESGITESILGWLKSDDDASGPARFSWKDAWENIKRGAREEIRKAQRALGQGLAPVVRNVFWDEMKGRAQGASAPRGGAALFVAGLFATMAQIPAERYKVHLVAHSAGSIYLGFLYQKVLRPLFTAPNITLGSLHFMAPAISVADAITVFQGHGPLAVPKDKFLVYTLKTQDEDNDSIQIYPSSLLTYVADRLESSEGRVPILGIRQDFDQGGLAFAKRVDATVSVKHGQFDDRGHEVETIFSQIGAS